MDREVAGNAAVGEPALSQLGLLALLVGRCIERHRTQQEGKAEAHARPEQNGKVGGGGQSKEAVIGFNIPRFGPSMVLHPLHDLGREQLGKLLFVHIQGAPLSFEKRETMGHSACRICRHQHEIDVPLSAFVPAISPEIAECHGIVRERLPRHVLKEFVKEIRQWRDALRILRRFIGVEAIRPSAARAEAVTVGR